MRAQRFVFTVLNLIAFIQVSYSRVNGFELDKDFWIVDPIVKHDGSNVRIVFYGAGRDFIIDASVNTQLYPQHDTTTPRCHYMGTIEGMKYSVVAISVCNNQFFGRIEWNTEHFYIESVNHATTGSTHILVREYSIFSQRNNNVQDMNLSMLEMENAPPHFVGLQRNNDLAHDISECETELLISINLVRDFYSPANDTLLLGYVNTANSYFKNRRFRRRLILKVYHVKLAEECNDVFSIGTATDHQHFFRLSAFREKNIKGDIMILFSGLIAEQTFGIVQPRTLCNKFVKTSLDGKQKIRADAAIIYESTILSNNAVALAQTIAIMAGAPLITGGIPGILSDYFPNETYPTSFADESIASLDALNLDCLCK
jgi:hypothetical protein